MFGPRIFVLALTLAAAGCASKVPTGAETTRAWACAPTRTVDERRTALAAANTWRAFWGQPDRLAEDCDGDGKPDFGPGAPPAAEPAQ